MMDAPLMVTNSLSVGIVHDAVIRTSLAKWAYSPSYPQWRVRKRVLRIWLDYSNLRRRLTAIGRFTSMQRPVEPEVTNVLGIYSQQGTPPAREWTATRATSAIQTRRPRPRSAG